MTVIRQRKTFLLFCTPSMLFLCVFTSLLTSPVQSSHLIGDSFIPPDYRMTWLDFLGKANYTCYQAIVPGVWVVYPGLQVVYKNLSDYSKKFSLVFDAGYSYADYKINMTFKDCLGYGFVVWNDTFYIDFSNYSIWFNHHDLRLLGNLLFNYGMVGSTFYFSVTKLHIRRIHVILDPRYTISNAYSSFATDYANGRKLVRMSNGTLMTAFLYGYGLSIPPRYVIRSARSVDAGVSWQILNVTATMSTSAYFSAPALWCNSTNHVHCVYANNTRIGYRYYEPSTKTWSSTETKIGDAAYAFEARYPSISGGYNDTLYVAWSQVTHATAGRDNIRFQSCTGGVWSGIVNLTDINSAGYICDMPNVVVDSVGDLYVFYRMKLPTGFGLYSIKRTGGVWDSAVLVSNILSTHALGMDAPCGAMYKNDSVCVVIGRNRYPFVASHDILFSTSNDSGVTWVNHYITGVAGHTLKYPSVAIDNLSYAHVVWIDNVTGTKGETIQYSNSTNFGNTFSSAVICDVGSTNRRSPGMLWCLSPKNATRHFDVPSVGFCFVWTNATTVRYYAVSTLAWNTQYVNRVPTVTILYPTTGETTDVGWLCSLNCSVSDLDFDLLSLTWRDNHSGVWSVFAYNNSVPNGVYRQINEDFNNLSETDYWNVSVSDGRLSAVAASRFATASKDINWVVNLENCTRTINAVYNKYTGWTLYENDTGNTTPIHQLENLDKVTGTHEYILNGTGYWDWANYTGNLTGLVLLENIINATGTHEFTFKPLLGVNGEWWVWANYTGNGTGGGINATTRLLIIPRSYFILALSSILICGSLAGFVLVGRRKRKV